MTNKQDTNSDNTNEVNEAAKDAESSDNNAVKGEASDEGIDLRPEVDRLQKELDAANAKADENWEHFVRTKADMENLHRRAQRDVENAHKYASEKFLEAMIPVIDSLEMGAHAASQEGADIEKLREGMELTLKMFADALHKFEVKKLDPVGDTFNPEFHQAMTMQESDQHAANTVLSVMQKGYLLNERLIRPALVVVSKAGNKKNNDSKDENASASSSDGAPEASEGKTVDEKA